MLQTTVRPNKENFDMQVSLPADYVGKEVHVLFYVEDEVKQTTASILPTKKPSDFFGTPSSEEGEKLQEYVKQSQSEKLAQLKNATKDPLFLADIMEIETDFKIADQENL
jgi:hypothetical protein